MEKGGLNGTMYRVTVNWLGGRKMNKVLVSGWITFAAFCNKYGVVRDGNEYRKLDKLSDIRKTNLSESNRPYWVVNEEACKTVFKIKDGE